jgi:hypothetical protein
MQQKSWAFFFVAGDFFGAHCRRRGSSPYVDVDFYPLNQFESLHGSPQEGKKQDCSLVL